MSLPGLVERVAGKPLAEQLALIAADCRVPVCDRRDEEAAKKIEAGHRWALIALERRECEASEVPLVVTYTSAVVSGYGLRGGCDYRLWSEPLTGGKWLVKIGTLEEHEASDARLAMLSADEVQVLALRWIALSEDSARIEVQVAAAALRGRLVEPARSWAREQLARDAQQVRNCG